jgi:class 3 adenylate cyclase
VTNGQAPATADLPNKTWERILGRVGPQDALQVGHTAYTHGNRHIAVRAWSQVILSGDAETAPQAAIYLGHLLAREGDTAGAREAYSKAITSGHPELAPQAANHLGMLLAEHGDVLGARAAYDQAITSGHLHATALAERNLGILIEQEGLAPARGTPPKEVSPDGLVCDRCGVANPGRARSCSHCGNALTESTAVALPQKPVTVLFYDVATPPLTQPDQQELHDAANRWRNHAQQVIERHGGTVAKYAGGGVMAVFGIPLLHEDDALRAARAAVELLVASAELNHRAEQDAWPSFRISIGISSGSGMVDEQALVLGETVNVAVRLQQAASAGEILISEGTYQLVHPAVTVESVRPVLLRGKLTPVSAWRLLTVDPGAMAHRRRVPVIPMVGREREFAFLNWTFQRVAAERTCHLVTVFGPGGVGKSRLIEEFRDQVKDQATVLAGHCLPYGESITFWPMVQLVRRAANAEATDPPKTVRAKLEVLVGDEQDHARIVPYLAQMLGVGPGGGPPSEIFWALRRLLEILAGERPLVVIIDDLHWAEQTLLDAIEYLADEARDVPILLVCMAREELLEHRRTWAGGKLNAHSISLPPLNDAEQDELISFLVRYRQLDQQARGVIARLAQGFPLYALEYVALLEDKLRPTAGQRVDVTDLAENLPAPATITALLAARLDHLPAEERRVIERAAVVGEQFMTAGVVALSPEAEPPAIETILETLLRQELIRPDRSPMSLLPVTEGGDSYRFRHVLIQETAYNRIAKEVRAELHERYATWLEQTAGPDRLSQFDELIGSHLGEAYRFRVELGFLTGGDRLLAQRAGERLAAAGHRAAARGNIELTQRLLSRAVELLPEGNPVWLEASLDRADALREAGQLEQATQVYRKVVEQATAADDQGVAMHARLGRLDVLAFSQPERMLLDGDRLVSQAIVLFVERGDDLGLAKAQRLKAYMDLAMGRAVAAERAAREAIELARSQGYEHLEAKVRRLLGIVLFWGPTPLDEVVAYASEALDWARVRGFPGLEAGALGLLARAAAMQGDFEHARQLNDHSHTLSSMVGERLTAAADSVSDGFVELLADDPATAEARLRVGYEALKGMVARALLLQGRDDEAEQLTRVCRAITAETQVDAQIRWRQLQAVILARRGDLERAEQLALEAVRRADDSEQPDTRAETRMDLAEVLRKAGHTEEAAKQVRGALKLYEAKGNQVAARKARNRLAMPTS